MKIDAERVTFEEDLFKVIEGITRLETEQLKFLCLEHIPVGTIEQMDITNLLQSLNEKSIISADKYDFLTECLILIGRNDIAHQLNCFTLDMQRLASNLQKYKSFSGLNSFIILLHTLADNMEEKEVEKIVGQLCETAEIEGDKIKMCRNGFQLMSLLLKVRHIHANNLNNLLDLVRIRKRSDLEEKIKLYQGAKEENKEPNFESDDIETGNEGAKEENKEPNFESDDIETGNEEKPSMDQCLSAPDTRQPEISSQPVPGIKLEKYKMTAKPRGICLIINNVYFRINGLTDRIGSDFDKDELKKVFGKFHFEIMEHTNLTKTEMQEKLDEVGSMDHGKYDCFVCCILSHGKEGTVFGVDGEVLDYKRIQLPFKPSKCRSLTGKPKLFFIQACQGSAFQSGEEEIEFDSPPFSKIPNEADFLMAYATVPGYVSIRDKKRGSWFIQNLCKIFIEHANSLDLSDMLLMVNNSVCKEGCENNELMKQVPSPVNMLRKKLFFL